MWLDMPDVSETLHSEREALKPSFRVSCLFDIFRIECTACSDTKLFYHKFIFAISLFLRTLGLERSPYNQIRKLQ